MRKYGLKTPTKKRADGGKHTVDMSLSAHSLPPCPLWYSTPSRAVEQPESSPLPWAVPTSA